MKNYKVISKIGEGTFSEVVKARSLRDGSCYACKQMKQHFDSMEQVNSLPEIQALRRLNPHPNILTLHEVVFDRKSGSLALICELMDMNVHELIRGRRHPFSEKKITSYMYQLCRSLDHMHRNGIFHRDVKPENILIKQEVLKLGDFGSCRSVYSKPPYTEYISTRWYRAPECLLTDGFYSYKMDLWSAGCVFYEIASLQPLFPGANELDQISKIHDVMGTPAARTLTKFKQSRAMSFDFPFKKGSGIPLLTASLSPQCLSLLCALVAYDPDERITAHQALQHPCFREQRAAEKQPQGGHGRAAFPECPAAPDLLCTQLRISKEGRKQPPSQLLGHLSDWVTLLVPLDLARRPSPAHVCLHGRSEHFRLCGHEAPVPAAPVPGGGARGGLSWPVFSSKQQEGRPWWPGPAGPTGLPRPKLAGATGLSSCSPALPSVFGPGGGGKVLGPRPLKCGAANQKTDPQKEMEPHPRQYHLPTIERKGRGC
ncbi:MAPK/MAK/MRK overlapping kinase [Pteronotus mesoamericanus]|uniref:MAPK/MAK/MRK overlapping kinase n=1 Tax=Pteronotus mesoamericanus TaxID=1884717 RepID=UPI0023EB3ABB|nr:MAPK/MAK/MRK overlapping kinase [Pteronotus parnellii mesoamericanus]